MVCILWFLPWRWRDYISLKRDEVNHYSSTTHPRRHQNLYSPLWEPWTSLKQLTVVDSEQAHGTWFGKHLVPSELSWHGSGLTLINWTMVTTQLGQCPSQGCTMLLAASSHQPCSAAGTFLEIAVLYVVQWKNPRSQPSLNEGFTFRKRVAFTRPKREIFLAVFKKRSA